MKGLEVIENAGQRVLTTAQLAECYGTYAENITYNFNQHRDKFVEGRHYFLLKGRELKEFKHQIGNSKVVKSNASHLYLWTEEGSLHHAKSLGTGKAWQVFVKLEETYFRAVGKEVKPADAASGETFPQYTEELLYDAFEEMKDIRDQVQFNNDETQAVKKDIQCIRDNMLIDILDWRTAAEGIISAVGRKLDNPDGPWLYVYRTLEKRACCRLSTRLKNLRNRELDKGLPAYKASNLTSMDVIDKDHRLKEIFISIVRELGIKYNVDLNEYAGEWN